MKKAVIFSDLEEAEILCEELKPLASLIPIEN